MQVSLEAEPRKLVDAVLDLERLKLITALFERPPMYLSEIAKTVEIDRATLAYHLGVLERAGLVTSEYKILQTPRSKGKAARYYTLNREKWRQALEEVAKLLPEVALVDTK
ncbi:helix-turn-helix transcriptional regulator [Candidatus Bathyarchaeota archaeon]|nr:MAG: helix-turn-helix transcriptional regulator [Candidatus Bathyarchaeota archaeon]